MNDGRAVAVVALVLFVFYLVVAFGIRGWLQLRATGDSGFRGISGRVGSMEWFAGALFVVAAVVVGIAGPLAGIAGMGPVAVLSHPVVVVSGFVLAVLGVVATVVAQGGMGSSWRVGVDATEMTALVTTGAFGWVRNPIFTAMFIATAGFALMVPNPVTLLGAVLLVVAIQLQVRVVEEPYLQDRHGPAYSAYVREVGRFVPGVGRR